MQDFLWGALTMASLTVSLLFLKYWRDTHDRLFAIFSGAFATLALNWLVLALAHPTDETRHYAYFVRLVSFVLILIGIMDKNRSRLP